MHNSPAVGVAVDVVDVAVVTMDGPQELHMIGQEREMVAPSTGSVHVFTPTMAQADRSAHGLQASHDAGQAF